MDTQRLRAVLVTAIDELGKLTPKEIDRVVGINRGTANQSLMNKALAAYLKARTDAKFRKEKPEVDVHVAHGDTKEARVENHDIAVHVGPKTDLVTLWLKAPPSLGVCLGISRYAPDKTLMPTLSEPERQLLAAITVLNGKKDPKLIAELLHPRLREELTDALTGQSPTDRRRRDLLTAHSLFPDELWAYLHSLS